jgi:hypothetical protein
MNYTNGALVSRKSRTGSSVREPFVALTARVHLGITGRMILETAAES